MWPTDVKHITSWLFVKDLSLLGSLQSLDWTSGLDWLTGLVDWTGGLDWWTDIFALKINRNTTFSLHGLGASV